jgi:hypothetical protein
MEQVNGNYTHVGFINKNLLTNEAIIFNKIDTHTRENIEGYMSHKISFLLSDIDIVLDKRSDSIMFLISKSGNIYYYPLLAINHKTLSKVNSCAVINLHVFTKNTAPSIACSNITPLCLPTYTFDIVGKRETHWDFINQIHLDNKDDTVSASDSKTPGVPILHQDYNFKLFNIIPSLKINFTITHIRFNKGSSPHKV